MSFFKHITECIQKTSAKKSTSADATGLSYSLLSCSPALLYFALRNKLNIIKLKSTV
jgi:hypothetical protein